MSKSRKSGKDEVVEIPVGRYLGSVRSNPWILSTIVLGAVLLAVIFLGGNSTTIGGVVSGDVAGDRLVSFINSQGSGDADLVSVDKRGSLYEVIVNYEGDDIPVFVTLDGEFLILDPVPLTAGALLDSSTGSTGPADDRVSVDITGAPFKGDDNAPIVIVEFTDYQCPFCQRHFTQTFSQIESEYIDTGKVKYVAMDFPLNFHPEAQKAAEAARCVRAQAGDEGYFEMHDTLFENQAVLNEPNYKSWARDIFGVNGADFDRCLDGGEFSDAVQADLAYGSSLGITGTPGFFINGVKISGALPFSEFKSIIDAELAA